MHWCTLETVRSPQTWNRWQKVWCNNIKDLIKFLWNKRGWEISWCTLETVTSPQTWNRWQKVSCLPDLLLLPVLIKKFYPCVDIYPVQDPIDHRFLWLNWYFRCWKPLDFKVWKTSFNQQMAADKELVSSLDTQKLINTYEHLFKLHNCSAKRNSCSCSAAKSRIPAIMTIYQ